MTYEWNDDFDPVDEMDRVLCKMLYRADDFAMVLANHFSNMFNLMYETHKKWAIEYTELLFEHETRKLKAHTQNAPIEENMKTLLLQYIGKLNPEDDVDFYDYVGDRFAATLYYQEIKDKLRVKWVTRLQAFVRGFLVRRKQCTYNPNTELGKRVIHAISSIPLVPAE